MYISHQALTDYYRKQVHYLTNLAQLRKVDKRGESYDASLTLCKKNLEDLLHFETKIEGNGVTH